MWSILLKCNSDQDAQYKIVLINWKHHCTVHLAIHLLPMKHHIHVLRSLKSKRSSLWISLLHGLQRSLKTIFTTTWVKASLTHSTKCDQCQYSHTQATAIRIIIMSYKKYGNIGEWLKRASRSSTLVVPAFCLSPNILTELYAPIMHKQCKYNWKLTHKPLGLGFLLMLCFFFKAYQSLMQQTSELRQQPEGFIFSSHNPFFPIWQR